MLYSTMFIVGSMNGFESNKSDYELAKSCAACDRNSQRLLFERVKQPMFGICLRFAESRPAAEDLLQDGFIRVFKDIGNYRGEGSLDGWIKQIFVRVGIEHFKKQKKLPQMVELATLENTFLQIFQDIDTEKDQSAIDILQKLPPGFRAVLNLAVLEEKSHEEIARELGIAVSTSRSQLSRAKDFLRKILNKTSVLV